MPQPLDQEHNEALERALDADRCEASPDARHSWTRKGPPQQVLWDALVTSKKQCAHCGIRARIYDHVRFGELTLKATAGSTPEIVKTILKNEAADIQRDQALLLQLRRTDQSTRTESQRNPPLL